MNDSDRYEISVREVQGLRCRESDAEAERNERVGSSDSQPTGNGLQ